MARRHRLRDRALPCSRRRVDLRRLALVSVAFATLSLPVTALAQAPPDAATAPDAATTMEQEVSELEAQIEREDVSLATGDCASACAALASMRRAAERLCALDPGPKCSAARANVEGAASR